MKLPKTTGEHRKHDRIATQYETLVYNDNLFGQLVDVSEGGLAFAYSKDQTLAEDLFLELNILCNNKRIHIKNLKCKAVSGFATTSSSAGHLMQRQGVQFAGLSKEQNDKIKEILKLDVNSLWLEQ